MEEDGILVVGGSENLVVEVDKDWLQVGYVRLLKYCIGTPTCSHES